MFTNQKKIFFDILVILSLNLIFSLGKKISKVKMKIIAMETIIDLIIISIQFKVDIYKKILIKCPTREIFVMIVIN